MLTTALAQAVPAVAAHPVWAGGGFGWWFLVIPFFWIVVIGLFFVFVGRRMRRQGPPWAGPRGFAGRSAEATLAQRFANGDIDETEYRARLEVLRANPVDGA